MPRSVVRHFLAVNPTAMEKMLDQYANSNPNWEIVSASHQFLPAGLSVVIVIRHIAIAAAAPPNSVEG